MRLPQFDYYSPQSLQEALDYLTEHKDQHIKILAGGTDLLVDMRDKVIPDGHRPRCQLHRSGPWHARALQQRKIDSLLTLACIPNLKGISVHDNHVRIGAMTTISELEHSAIINSYLSALSDGASQLGSPLVRNRGTYGGNLCNARPAADTAIPTLALSGKLVLSSPRGERIINHEEFVTGPGETILEADEILKEIIFDLPERRIGSAYIKLTNRKALEISVVGAAAAVVFESETGEVHTKQDIGIKGGIVAHARIALGAVAPKPLLVSEAGDELIGREMTPEVISKAARMASQKARPITDHRGGAEYRKMMIEVLVRRALNECRVRAFKDNLHEAHS